jgi:FCD domain-containing protein
MPTADTRTSPTTMSSQAVSTPMSTMPDESDCMVTAPWTPPGMVPMPPANEVPPITAAAMTCSSTPVPSPDDAAFSRADVTAAAMAASHNPVIETMFASIDGLTVELMVRSASDAEIIRQSEPYHRIAWEAIRDRDAAAARAAIQAHLSIAASTYVEDYDRRLDTTATRALRLIGSGAGLEESLRAVLPDGADSEGIRLRS